MFFGDDGLDIREIDTANVKPWDKFFAGSLRRFTFKAYDEFAEDFTRVETDPTLPITMLQHVGVRYGLCQEDKLTAAQMPYSDAITLTELKYIIQKSIFDLSEDVHMQQLDGKLLHTGCTMAGFLVWGDHVVTFNKGDSALAAISLQPGKVACIPLQERHTLKNPAEQDRMLKQTLSQHYNEKKLPKMLRRIKQFHAALKKDFDVLYKTHEGENYLTYYLLYRAKLFSQDVSQEIKDFLNKKVNKLNPSSEIRVSFEAFFTLIERGFASGTFDSSERAFACFSALCNLLYERTISFHGGEFHSRGPSRIFGNLIAGAKTHLCEAEISIYRRQANVLYVAMTDGIADYQSVADVTLLAQQHHELNGLNTPENIENFIKALCYQAYKDNKPHRCDNISAAVYLSKPAAPGAEPQAVLVAALDGLGNAEAHAEPNHVVNYVQLHLQQHLRRNLQAVIDMNKVVQQLQTAGWSASSSSSSSSSGSSASTQQQPVAGAVEAKKFEKK